MAGYGFPFTCLSCLLILYQFASLTLAQGVCTGPVDCIVSDWTEYSSCSQTCGDSGVQTRTRTILQEARCGGTCSENTEDTVECNRQCCPKNCVYKAWTNWYPIGKSTNCSLPGERPVYERERILLESASCGGYCDHIYSEQKCGDLLCIKHCALDQWSIWSVCQGPCEQKGIRQRTRQVKQEAECGGDECGIQEEEEHCTAGCCPVHCQLGQWSTWSVCDVTCGTTNQTRSRFVQLPECKGDQCPEDPKSVDVQTCEVYINVDCTVSYHTNTAKWRFWSDNFVSLKDAHPVLELANFKIW